MNKVLDVLLGASVMGSIAANQVFLYVAMAVVIVCLSAVIVVMLLANKKQSATQPVATVVEEQPAEEVVTEPVTVATEQQPAAVATEQVVDKPTLAVEQQPAVTVVAEQQPAVREVAPDVVRRGAILIRYDKSFTARLIQAEDDVRDYYNELKNELLSYMGVKSRISWKYETFRKGRKLIAKLKIRGKHVTLYLALNPADYMDSKYKIDDVSDVKVNADTPCAYAIKNDRRCRYAKELIAKVMGDNEIEKWEKDNVQYTDNYPYDTTEHLIERKLIKLVYSKKGEVGEEIITIEQLHAILQEEPEQVVEEPVHAVTVEEAHVLMTDEQASHSVEQGTRYADKSKPAIINVDTLSQYFHAGEKVTLEEIKKRVPGFGKKVTYIKVLARGSIDKALTVEADEFSLDAIKMIALSGGTVIRTLKK